MKFYFLLPILLSFFNATAQFNSKFDQIKKVDFKELDAAISINPSAEEVRGEIRYNFEILEETDSIFIDAKNMEFRKVMVNGKEAKFSNDGKRLWLLGNFKPSAENGLVLEYSAEPEQAMYFINWEIPKGIETSRQVWTQGQGRYSSHWLPSFDDMREKIIFDLEVEFPEGYQVIANGEQLEKKQVNDSVTSWKFSMDKPMSSYLVAIAAGNFEKEETVSSSGVPISLFYEPKDEEKVSSTYKYTKKIFDFLEEEIGYPYPWKNYKQIPVQDFLYSGMENTGATIFSNSLMVDSVAFNDLNYVNVNAHELAHQWFGNLVSDTNGQHHWLHEGFATFFALLAEKEIFGDNYYYWKLFDSAEQLKALSDSGKGESLLNEKASSLTFYQKGAWALHILREKVGEGAFKEGIQNYLEKYAYKNVTTEDFLAEIEKTSGMDLSEFRKNWLEQSAFRATEALSSLKKSEFIKNYMGIAALRELPIKNKLAAFDAALDFPVNDYIGQEVVYQLREAPMTPEVLDLYNKALESGNLYVRQAIATSLEVIPKELKSQYISLLEDDSYLTIENALLKLALQYPGQAEEFLQKTKGVEGFSNKNVRILWLTLNLISPHASSEEKEEYYNELSGYTATFQPFEIRQNAFGYLFQLDAFTDRNLLDLVEATQHHTYIFRDFSRKLLNRLLQEEKYRTRFSALKDHLRGKELEYLNNLLEK